MEEFREFFPIHLYLVTTVQLELHLDVLPRHGLFFRDISYKYFLIVLITFVTRFNMKLLLTIQTVLDFVILASVVSARTIYERQDEKTHFIADLANQLNENIAQTTHFFETFPTLTGSTLRIQADVAETALQSAIGVVDTIALELSDNDMAQVINSNLLDNNLLLEISLQLQNFAEGINSNHLLHFFYCLFTEKMIIRFPKQSIFYNA